MTRQLKESDIPTLRSMFERSGFKYTFPDLSGPMIEGVVVVTDENDNPVGAVAAERICQLYLWMDQDLHPAAKLRYIRGLHETVKKVLCVKGYKEANCFVPPELEQSFGRRLMKTFGWVRNWPSFARSF